MEENSLDQPITRATLIARIQAGRKELDQVIQSLTEEDLTRPDAEAWSVKDQLAHMTSWSKGVVALLHKQSRWEGMGLSHSMVQGLDLDAINALMDQLNKDRSLTEVQADFQRTYEAMIESIQAVEDADLTRSYLDFQPSEEDWESGWSIVTFINANSWEHYNEHIPWLRTFQKNLKK